MNSDLEFIIDFAWSAGANIDTINNAKNELKKIRQKIVDLSEELFNVKQDFVQCQNDLSNFEVCAWVRINDRGDLYDPRLNYNCQIDNKTIMPIYKNKEEYNNYVENLSE